MHPRRSVDGFRSLPHKRPFLAAAFLALVHYLSLIAAITLALIITKVQDPRVVTGLFIAIGAIVLSWLFGYFHRASAKCPLCKGTPLLDSVAVKHRNAYRIPPLNYGTTAQISLLMSHRFRCMYCGTGFDILRKSSKLK
jgi:uncharacterized membrane protein (DUF485 family)